MVVYPYLPVLLKVNAPQQQLDGSQAVSSQHLLEMGAEESLLHTPPPPPPQEEEQQQHTARAKVRLERKSIMESMPIEREEEISTTREAVMVAVDVSLSAGIETLTVAAAAAAAVSGGKASQAWVMSAAVEGSVQLVGIQPSSTA